jgi:hypothetical protein
MTGNTVDNTIDARDNTNETDDTSHTKIMIQLMIKVMI